MMFECLYRALGDVKALKGTGRKISVCLLQKSSEEEYRLEWNKILKQI